MLCRTIHALLIVFFLLATSYARAENDCGLMKVKPVRFVAQVDSVEPLAGFSGTTIDVDDLDAQHILTITIRELDAGEDFRDAPISAGARMNLAVHSPSRSTGVENPVGRQVMLLMSAMHCDDRFRRYLDLVPVAPLRPQLSPDISRLDDDTARC